MTITSDVLVVGGGIVGTATAYFLAQRGFKTVLLEGQSWAWGASGRNPGFQWLHTRKAGLQMELGLAGRRLSDRLAEELDGFEFRRGGGMIYFFDEAQEPLMECFVAERRAAGLPMELIDGRAAREHCPALSPKVLGASFNPIDAHQNTKLLVEALARAAERAGATIRAGVQVDRLLVEKGRVVGAAAGSETFRAGTTVLATGVWTAKLMEPLGVKVPITAMRLQVVETEPAPFRFDPMLYGPTALKQYAFIRDLDGYSDEGTSHPLEARHPGIEFLELAAQRADGRVLLGGPMDFPGLDDRPTVAGIGLTLAVMAERMPPLADLAIERVWAGLLPQTPDALPILGPVPGLEGLVLNAGHVFGNVAGPISGLMVAQKLAGERPQFDLSLFAFDRPGLRANNEQHRRW
ncbi:MAG TPA: FAD-binding oxidoreductase [Alphaproteobacteria bacterium]